MLFVHSTHDIAGTFQEAGVIKEAYNLNHPLQIIATHFAGTVIQCVNVQVYVWSTLVLLRLCRHNFGTNRHKEASSIMRELSE